MNMFYYSDGSNALGPFSLEELKQHGITKSTLVYIDDTRGWVQAGSLEELKELFQEQKALSTPNASHVLHSIGSLNSNPPKNHLIESILVTLFCCLPFGIAGIVNAAKVDTRFYSGDIEGSLRYSKEAKKWLNIGFWSGIMMYVLYFLLFLLGEDSGY
jgi:hypothetical protein